MAGASEEKTVMAGTGETEDIPGRSMKYVLSAVESHQKVLKKGRERDDLIYMFSDYVD